MARVHFQINGDLIDPKELKWGVTHIGRGTDNEIVINDPSVSYHHCELELGLETLILRDPGSTNGTFVNGERITEAHLEPNQSFRIGQIQVTVEWAWQDVAVPKPEVQRLAESVALNDGVFSCRNHNSVPATWLCPKCKTYLCSACIRGVHLVGRPEHRLCPLCSTHVELPPWLAARKKPRSVIGRIKKAFSRTLRLR